MTKVSAKPSTPHDNEKRVLVVYGFDENDKPRAARFDVSKSELVKKAAIAMELSLIETATDDQLAIAKKLPEGKLYANGRGFVPHVRRELYLKLVAQVGPAADPANNGAPNASLPASWQELASGHLVLAQASLIDGWWEAVVVERKDDVLHLRWRDFPKYPQFTKHVVAVALMSPPTSA